MTDIPHARPSATAILARETGAEPELLMVKRNDRASFGGAFVFPGGVVEAVDECVSEFSSALSSDEADTVLGLQGCGLGYFSAALRELFEETGILLAASEYSDTQQRRVREQLLAGELSWPELLRQGKGQLLCGGLHYVSFWITPNALPKRYSTRFFVAELTRQQDVSHQHGELTDSRWMSAATALKANDESEIKLHFPTRITLEGLAEHRTMAELMAWAKQRNADGVPCIYPELPDEDAVKRALGADHSRRE